MRKSKLYIESSSNLKDVKHTSIDLLRSLCKFLFRSLCKITRANIRSINAAIVPPAIAPALELLDSDRADGAIISADTGTELFPIPTLLTA